MKTITLPNILGIVIELGEEDIDLPGTYDGGTIKSDMAIPITDMMTEDEREDAEHFNGRINILEQIILNCAISGVDVTSNAFVEAIESTFELVNGELSLKRQRRLLLSLS